MSEDHALTARFRTVRAATEALAAPLSAEDQTVQSMPDVSPTKWHRGHTTWFFETFVLAAHVPGHAPLDPGYDYLFNSYYETVGERHPRARRGMVTRPGVDEVTAYRRHVDEAVVRLLDAGAVPDELEQLVVLGLHHEQQHQELLLMDAQHVLWQSPSRPAYLPAPVPPVPLPDRPTARWHDLDGGVVEVGHDGAGFAFDNEGPRHEVLLRPFRIADRLVTNGEWLEFMADGGYDRHELWLSDGWAQVRAEEWRAPLYWEELDGHWHRFDLHGRRPVDAAAPVAHVSHFEADAFARWAGARLPTEFEWEHAVAHLTDGTVPDRAGTAFAASPVPAGPVPASPVLADRGGQVWQWTASAYLPFPGFVPAAGAVGEYNGKFMSGQMVLRGSSCLTPAGHGRATYRNFFPPGARWAAAGLRLAADR